MNKESIERINFLANKKKTVGLSNEELEEQSKLRSLYLAEYKKQFKEILDNTKIKEPDGTIRPLKKDN